METKKLSKSLTDNRFGGWGWSMIFYTMILYFFYAAITTDGMNLIPSAFAEAHGWDANTLLSVATPAGLVGLVEDLFLAVWLLRRNRKICQQ